MDYRFLGRTGLRVSPLCLGTMNFGPQTDETTSHQIMDAALEAGINFFDTANVYGELPRPSRSSAAGSRRAAAGARRSCWPPRSTAVRDRGRTRRGCRRCTSARRARTACGACRPTTSTSTRCTTSTATRRGTRSGRRWSCSSQQGKVLYVGSSNFAGWHIAQANEAASRRGSLGPGVRAEPLQPQRPHGRARGAAGLPGLRRRRHPVEPARRRPARRGAAQGHRGPPRRASASRPQVERQPRQARGVGGAVRRAGRGPGRRGAGVAAAPAGRHRPDHRAPHRSSSSPVRYRALDITARGRTRSTPSTRSSPAPAAPPPRPTPGDHDADRRRYLSDRTGPARRLPRQQKAGYGGVPRRARLPAVRVRPDPIEPDVVHLFERWESKEALAAHLERARSQPPATGDAPQPLSMSLVQYEIGARARSARNAHRLSKPGGAQARKAPTSSTNRSSWSWWIQWPASATTTWRASGKYDRRGMSASRVPALRAGDQQHRAGDVAPHRPDVLGEVEDAAVGVVVELPAVGAVLVLVGAVDGEVARLLGRQVRVGLQIRR